MADNNHCIANNDRLTPETMGQGAFIIGNIRNTTQTRRADPGGRSCARAGRAGAWLLKSCANGQPSNKLELLNQNQVAAFSLGKYVGSSKNPMSILETGSLGMGAGVTSQGHAADPLGLNTAGLHAAGELARPAGLLVWGWLGGL